MDVSILQKFNTLITLLEQNKIAEADDFFRNKLQYLFGNENTSDEIIDLLRDIDIYITWGPHRAGVDIDSIKIDFFNIKNKNPHF